MKALKVIVRTHGELTAKAYRSAAVMVDCRLAPAAGQTRR
jgi:hypothetical protein